MVWFEIFSKFKGYFPAREEITLLFKDEHFEEKLDGEIIDLSSIVLIFLSNSEITKNSG